MKDIIIRIRTHAVFFAGYLLVLIPAAVWLAVGSKREIFLSMNGFHTPALDAFFKMYTNVGDGLFAVLLSLLIFFAAGQRKPAVILLIAFASTGIVAQVIKPLVESPRPASYFAPEWFPFFIRDIIHTGNSSFPSGHTITAFAVATVLALQCRDKWKQLLLLLLAILVAYSRVYLCQHFLADIVAGSFIGTVGGVACVHLCRNIKEEKLVFRKKDGA